MMCRHCAYCRRSLPGSPNLSTKQNTVIVNSGFLLVNFSANILAPCYVLQYTGFSNYMHNYTKPDSNESWTHTTPPIYKSLQRV